MLRPYDNKILIMSELLRQSALEIACDRLIVQKHADRHGSL